ncbi:MAG: aminopeptidase N [Rhizobiaceae bacterium]
MRTDTATTVRLEDYRPTDYAVKAVGMLFRLDPEKTIVTAKIAFERREGTVEGTALSLDGDGLKLVTLDIEGQTAVPDSFAASPERLVIHRPPSAKYFTVTIVTEIDPSSNKALMGLYRAGGIYCTQCEAEGFRRITYFLDRPDILAIYSVRIEAKRSEAPLLLSNGNPVHSGDLADGWHFAEWHDPFPKPSYLFALVAGDLGVLEDDFVTVSGRHVALKIYVEHGKEPRATYAMDALKRSMKWDEEVFGLEYDLDLFMIVAVSSFNMGAMENKGLNIFNDKYVLADPDTATDTDYAGIEAVIAHEYFHNWTGNRITCRDWFQLCLKEGLTVFRDHEFSADMRSRAVKRIAEVRGLKANQFPEDQGPLAHPVRPRKYREINNFYTSTVYEKGSEVVRMIRTILGAETFKAGLDLYFSRHDGNAATIEDFIACFEDVSSRDLSQFALWYHQAGTPTLMVTADYNKPAQAFTLDFEQVSKPTPGDSRKKLMHIPVKFALLGTHGETISPNGIEGFGVAGDVIHIRKKKQRVVFHGVRERPVPSLLRGFSAPVNLAFEQKAEDRLFLARHDNDLFSRWQALNLSATEGLIAAVNSIRGRRKIAFDAKLMAVLAEVAANEELEPAFRALALTLPLEGDIAREIGRNVDPDAILAARNTLIGESARLHSSRFESVMSSLHQDTIFSPSAASAGRRALRNVLMDYLSVLSGEPALAEAAYAKATNMTDRLAALSVLCARFSDTDAAKKALKTFEDRFGHDGLVMDKWFAVQAIIPGEATLERVISLTKHQAFSFANPNRMRSLIGTFATSNPTGFNRKDGAAYRFLADFILTLDKTNPQTAARILTAMRSWRSLEPTRKEKAREALARIASAPSLSPDVQDIVERTLA